MGRLLSQLKLLLRSNWKMKSVSKSTIAVAVHRNVARDLATSHWIVLGTAGVTTLRQHKFMKQMHQGFCRLSRSPNLMLGAMRLVLALQGMNVECALTDVAPECVRSTLLVATDLVVGVAKGICKLRISPRFHIHLWKGMLSVWVMACAVRMILVICAALALHTGHWLAHLEPIIAGVGMPQNSKMLQLPSLFEWLLYFDSRHTNRDKW